MFIGANKSLKVQLNTLIRLTPELNDVLFFFVGFMVGLTLKVGLYLLCVFLYALLPRGILLCIFRIIHTQATF